MPFNGPALTGIFAFALSASPTLLGDEPSQVPQKAAVAKVADSFENISADQALELLKAGNQRFLAGESKHPHEDPDWRRQLYSGQHPFATILGCSDSRVIPELIFDEGLGDLFVIRVAGNIVDDDVLASIEYSVNYLDTHLVVVLGHERCGAVTAAMQHLSGDGPRELINLIEHLHDEVCQHHEGEPDVDATTDISTAIYKNVRCSQRALVNSPEMKKIAEKHPIRVIGAIYALDGSVTWLDN